MILLAGNFCLAQKIKPPTLDPIPSTESQKKLIAEGVALHDRGDYDAVPYFAELKKQGHTEAFVYYIHQQGNMPGTTEWLSDHQDQVNSFLNWSKTYKWRLD